MLRNIESNKISAFSLVELSIVLVILGLLVGGVLSGQSLIRAAELRSVTTDVARARTAVYTFRDKYFAMPGDMPNATNFWGTDADGCPTHTNRVAKSQTCNGNGDGNIDANAPEQFRAWQHLANAGLIEGSYSGVVGTASVGDHDPGINSPKLRVGNTIGLGIGFIPPIASGGVVWAFPGNYGNLIQFGSCVGWDCIEGGFKPEEAWNIDTKLDDGKPGTGILMTRPGCPSSGCQIGCNSATTDNPTTAQATAAVYSLNNTTPSCAFYFTNL